MEENIENTGNEINEPVKKETKSFFKKFIDDVASNVKGGATFVGEKVAQTSAKAYIAGSELVSETSDKIHEFTEKQTLHKEEDKIEKRQVQISNLFGKLALDFYLEKDALNKAFLTSEPVAILLSELQTNKLRLQAITKELEELENN